MNLSDPEHSSPDPSTGPAEVTPPTDAHRETPPADESSPSPEPAASPPSSDDEVSAPSEDFRRALEDFERDPRSAATRRADVEAGARVHGTLISIGDEQSLVDFGGRSEGVIETRHLRDEAGELRHAVGDALDLWVVEAGDQIVLAPSMRADPRQGLQQVREAQESGVPVTGRVTARNAGGLEVDLSGVRGFCPVSQIEAGYCADPSIYVGRTLEFVVTKVDTGRGNAILSRRKLLARAQADQAKELLAGLKPGDELEGTVARLEEFGAFIDLGGIDGLVHVSEIRHERTAHPRDALSRGDRVRVRVLKIDSGKGGRKRIALSIKAAQPDPWAGIEQRFHAGDRVRGTVARLTDFGAFVMLLPGVDGLVHVSEAADHPVQHVKEVLQPGQEIEAVVLGVDPAKKRVSLSVRAALAGEQHVVARMPAVGERVEGFVAGIQPYGVFVDLPAYGHRARGLAPRQELGEPRGSDLAKRFAVGDPVEVEVIEIREGKIRVRLMRADRSVERGAEQSEPRRGESRRGDPRRGESRRGESKGYTPERREDPTELTPMAIALRRAMERARARESGGSN